MLRTHRVDVLHLRMAEVGSLAAAEVARELGIPVVFTLAPDPHAVIHALDMTGALHRGNFGAADEREHYWFRARLVQRLAADAAHIVLFPRPELQHDMRELLGIDVAGAARAASPSCRRASTWGSGRAAAELERPGAPGRRWPSSTRSSPRCPSTAGGCRWRSASGRLHRVKGMATLVEAWAGDAELGERCNLLIVGGDLADPSPDEREQLDLIAGVLARLPAAADGPDAARPPPQRRGGALAGGGAGGPGRGSARPGSTCAAASRRSSAWRCWRRWRPGWWWSARPPADRRPTSRTG